MLLYHIFFIKNTVDFQGFCMYRDILEFIYLFFHSLITFINLSTVNKEESADNNKMSYKNLSIVLR